MEELTEADLDEAEAAAEGEVAEAEDEVNAVEDALADTEIETE